MSDIPRMRCPICRMWIDAPPTATRLPLHEDPLKEQCRGSNQRPVEKIGPFRS